MIENLRSSEAFKPKFSIITGFSCVDVCCSGIKPPYYNNNFPNNLERRFPGGLVFTDNLLEANPDGYPKVKLLFQDSPNPYLITCELDCFELSGPSELICPRLPYIAYNITEKIRQEKLGMSTLHAAAVSTPDGRSLLILGDKGSGKTSLTLALCLDYGCQLIGNDLVLANNQGNQLLIPAGTKIFDIREGVINNYFPELKNYIPNQRKNNPYENKISLIPEQIGIISGQDTQGLLAVIRINLHPHNAEIKIDEGVRRKEEILRLRENLARYIKGLVTPLILGEESFGGYFPTMDSPELSEMRDQIIERIICNNFMYVCGSNPRSVAEEIIRRLSL
jgi:hypothetical protein